MFYNPISLRDYQYSLVDDIRSAFSGGSRAPLVRSETGSGKTRIFCHVAAGAQQKNNVTWVLAHRRELIQQTSLTFAEFGIRHAIVAPPAVIRMIKVIHFKLYGQSFIDKDSKLFIASVQTVVNKTASLPKPNLIIIDEAHHATVNNTWGRIIDEFPLAKLLMVSATPCRTDGTGIGAGHGGYADVMLHGPSMQWLIGEGYLSDYVPYAAVLDGAKTDGFHSSYGDHVKSELEEEYSKPTIIGSAVDSYIQHANGLPCATFCVSIKNAEIVAEEYRARGIRAVSVDGTMDATERSRRINGLGDGSLDVLTSADLIGEGLDIPSITVCQLLRPTKSFGLYRQQVGRALRPAEGKKHAIILDHVGNIGRDIKGVWTPNHGLPDQDVEWSLEGVKKGRRKSENEESPVIITRCPRNPEMLFRSPQVCEGCDCKGKDRKIKQVEGELVEISKEQKAAMRVAATRVRKKEEGDCVTLEDFIELGKQRGYQYPTAWGKKRFGFRHKKA